jgi:hypothetical protein
MCSSLDLAKEPLNLAVGLGMIHPGSDMPNPMGLKEFSKGMICRFWVPG